MLHIYDAVGMCTRTHACTHAHAHTHTHTHAHTHQITMAVLKQVTDKICDEMQSLEEGEETDQIRQHFENTQQHMQHVKESDRG